MVEMLMPAFGIWGVAGIGCFILGSIYFVDTDQVWSASGFSVNKTLVGSVAVAVGGILMSVCYLALKSARQSVRSGPDRLIGESAVVLGDFKAVPESGGKSVAQGKVKVGGEIWNARMQNFAPDNLPAKGQTVLVEKVDGLVVEVKSE